MTLTLTHNLEKEFPNLSPRLKELLATDPLFQQNSQRYVAIDKEITHLETEAACSDFHMEDLKKERLALKDKLYYALTHP